MEGLIIDLNSAALKSDEHIKLIKNVEDNKQNFPDLKVEGCYLYRKADHLTGEQMHDEYAWKLWIPKELVHQVLSLAHDSALAAHGGVHKTIERIRRYYFWPRLVSEVRAYISACEIFKCSKASNFVLRTLGKAPDTQRFFQRLFVDFLGPYPRSRSGNVGIFIVLDNFS